MYGESVWFECVSVVRVERAPPPCSAGRSTMRASVSVALALTLMLVKDVRRVCSCADGRTGSSRASVEGGVGTECVWVCELDSW